ncbi:MAG: peptidase M14 [Bacteroidia bacterium]|nr:peptidase M14 [Bacteroidia bacterium]
MKTHLSLFVCLTFLMTISCKESPAADVAAENITTSLYDTYETYKEPSLDRRRIKHSELQPLLQKFGEKEGFEVTQVGTSIEGRSLNLISLGEGETDVFLWSQMHGDEPTATQAIFDILNFFDSEDFTEEKNAILKELRIHFLPMLNPDGAEIFHRRNRLGIDINRDALRLQSPEGQTLKKVRDSLEADFGFNLHDQSTYYNAERTPKPATISYLAPAYNYEKEINEVRADAMRVIVFMNSILQKYAQGQVGRYNDSFEPRAFGDNIQKWGTSTILIESGGYLDDPEKQEIRKLNYVSILSAIYTIATAKYKNIDIAEYENIPHNDRKLVDLKLEGVTYELEGDSYLMDVAINQLEVDEEGNNDFWYSSRVYDQGDLSTYYGYETFKADGYTIMPGKVYPSEITNESELESLDATQLLKEGYLYVRMKEIPEEWLYSSVPVHIISSEYEIPDFALWVGTNPSFFLGQGDTITHAVVNGFLLDLSTEISGFTNAMIYR